MRKIIILGAASLGATLAGCTAQQSANLEAAAVASCNAAEIASAATIRRHRRHQCQQADAADAATAQKVTSDACTALQKLPSVAAAAKPAS